MPKVLVTGGAGFLGSHLVSRLLRRNIEVHVVDTFITGRVDNLESGSRAHRGRLVVHARDAAEAPFGKYELVYHLASPASPPFYLQHQRETLLVNSLGTLRTLEIAARSHARYLLASTSEIYGDPLLHPQPETYWGNVNPIGPRSSYDEGKRFAEALVVAFVREVHLDARIVRIFNTYGPRMRPDDGRMPSAFIVAALEGRPVCVEGSGRQTRSLCYIDDTIEGIIAAMERGRPGEAYNIGRPEEVTVKAFAQKVIRLARSPSTIRFVRGREEDIRRRKPDIRKARRELGWRPRVPLDRGLLRTIAWFENQRQAELGSRDRR